MRLVEFWAAVRMFLETWIVAHPILAVFAALLLLELLYIASQAAFALALARPPYRGLRLRWITLNLAIARRRTLVHLIARLFPIRAPSTHRDRSAAAWRLWHRAHIPPYVVRQLRWWQGRQQTIIECVFDGLAAAAQGAVDVTVPLGEGERSRVSFDEFWPLLECIEELAVHTHVANHGAFAVALADFAAAIDDEAVQAQVGWVVNELLERTAAEQALAVNIADALLASEAVASVEALRTLVAYKREKVGEDDEPDPAIEAIAKKVAERTPIIALPATLALSTRCDERRTELFQLANAIGAQVRADVVYSLETKTISEATAAAVAGQVTSACEPLLTIATVRSGIDGVIALAALRLVLRQFCSALLRPPSDTAAQPDSARTWPGADLVTQSLCTALMQRCEANTSGFVLVEALETVRDKRTEDTARAMAAFVGKAHGQLDSGIAVCICEGIEEQLQGRSSSEPPAKVPMPRFRWWRGRWRASRSSKTLGPIGVFWETAPLSFRRRVHDVPRWMNVRLALRRRWSWR
jgi:hypothetical protein